MLFTMASSSLSSLRWSVLAATVVAAFVACVGDTGPANPDSSVPDTGGPDTSAPDAAADGPQVCTKGTADCSDAGTCMSLANDDHNCGACGHDCGGANLCAQGVCQPMVILDKIASPIALTVNGPSVFWYVDGEIDRCPVTGCPNPFPSDVGNGIHVPKYWQGGSLYLDVDSNDAWWPGWTTDNTVQSVYYCPVAGCGQNPPSSTGVGDDNYSTEMAGNTNFLYWINGNNGTLTRIRKLDRTSIHLGIPYLLGLAHVAADDNHVIVTDTSGTPNTGGVYVCSDPTTDCSGGFPKLLDTGNLVTTNATGVFVTQPGSSTSTVNVVECDYPGCSATPTTLAKDEHLVAAVTADSSGVYWATKDGSIRGCTLPGCTGGVHTYATMPSAVPQAIATDAGFIYWANLGTVGDAGGVQPNTGSVMRVRK
jgi:hypothetical protein